MPAKAPATLARIALACALALAAAPIAAAQDEDDDDMPEGDDEVRSETVEGVRPPHRDTIEGAEAAARDPSPKRPPRRTTRKRPTRPAPPRLPAGPVEIPIDVGVGPAVLIPNLGPVFDDSALHFGLAVSLAAVVDQELIRKYAGRIPAEYRSMARNLEEVRVRPWFLVIIPELFIISPQLPVVTPNTGMYGAVWRPIGIGISPISDPVRVSLGADLDLAYILIHSATLGGGTASAHSFTHFLRPGVNLDVTAELPITKTVLLSAGWSSDFFIPQPIGRTPFEIEPVDQALWHLGGPFVKLHFRIPYEAKF